MLLNANFGSQQFSPSQAALLAGNADPVCAALDLLDSIFEPKYHLKKLGKQFLIVA